MRTPRFRLRTLIVTIAILALSLTVIRQSILLRQAAAREQLLLAVADEQRALAEQQRILAEHQRALAEQHRALAEQKRDSAEANDARARAAVDQVRP